MNHIPPSKEFQDAALAGSYFVAKEKDVLHLIRNGALVYTWLDLETTDKEWMHLEVTVASLTTTDIAYNLLSDDLYEVCVPDRVGLSPEAMLITRYMAEDVRNPKRLSPQHAVTKIFEDVQDAPLKLWNKLGSLKQTLRDDLWDRYIEEKKIEIAGKSGKKKSVLVRHMPLLNERGEIVRNVRVHEPSSTREFLQMSYKTDDRKFDYEDEHGWWRVRNLDKFNLGFRNTFFDNRAMAAALFRANFPLKEIYAMNKKGLGNHAVDVFTAAIANHFFSHKGRERLSLGERRDAETSRMKISAKLDLVMDENTRIADPDVDMPPGVRVYDGTLHNIKKGHNAPDYDNAKSIGVHSYLRHTDNALLAHIESLGNIDHFRRFMTADDEEGSPTTHPIRFIITSANDDKIYRAIPVFVLGSDDQHGKFNRIWAMRADIDYRTHRIDGKLVTDMTEEEMASLMKIERGHPGAIFHEIHLKRHRGVVDLQTGLRAGHCPGHSADALRYMRDFVIGHYDDSDKRFLPKAMNAFGRKHAFTPPADDIAPPYVEEEIWTAMGEVKYTYIKAEDGTIIHLPKIIRNMAQDEFNRINQQMGDTIRALVRVQPLELERNEINAYAYAVLRAKQQEKLHKYQQIRVGKKYITLPPAQYDSGFLGKKSDMPVPVDDIFATMMEDKLHLIDKIDETTRAYEVQQLIPSIEPKKPRWQRIPFTDLAKIPENRLNALKDDGRLRVVFEPNPNRPAYRFMVRYFMENGWGALLEAKHREFYHAETALYVNGPPYIKNALDHKAMSWPKMKISIEKILTNEHPGHPYMRAGRAGETGAHDMFIKDDMDEAVLASVERDGRRIFNANPLTPSRKLLFGIDPVTNRHLPNVKYEIPSKHIIVRVPDAHPSMTASYPRFGHTCLVIPHDKKLEKARHIIIEEEKTRRRYLAAEPVLNPLPPRSQGQYEEFYRTIDAAYTHSGQKPPKEGYVLSCAELAPVSRMRDPKYPAVYIPQEKLIATRAPMLANLRRDTPLTGFVRRKYDLALKEGQKIRLRGTDENNKQTGWEATARVRSAPVIFTMKDFLENLRDPAKTKEMAHMSHACGFDTTDHMKAYLLEEFTRFDEAVLDSDNIFIFFEIDPVKKINHWTNKQPRACFVRKEMKKVPRLKKQTPALKLAGKQKQILQFTP